MLIDVVQNNGKIVIIGTKKVLTLMIKNKSFKKSLKLITDGLNKQLIIFIEANGYKVSELIHNNTDLNEILSSNPHYKEFISKYMLLQKNIEDAQYISENPIYLQRKLNNELKDIKSLVEKLYPEHKPKHKVVNYSTVFFNFAKKSLITIILLIGFLFLCGVGYILIQELLIRL